MYIENYFNAIQLLEDWHTYVSSYVYRDVVFKKGVVGIVGPDQWLGHFYISFPLDPKYGGPKGVMQVDFKMANVKCKYFPRRISKQ
jgi:hypothetical protein